MAVVKVDDIDNTVHSDEGTQVLTWHFAFGPEDGMKTYTIDLTTENYDAMVALLDKYVEAGDELKRPVAPTRITAAGTRRTRAANGTAAPTGAKQPVTEKGHTAQDIRDWLSKEGFGDLVKGQGRLSQKAIDRWNEDTDHKDDQYLGAKAAAEKGITLASDSVQAA